VISHEAKSQSSMGKNQPASLAKHPAKTREPQYQECVDAVAERGLERLGLRSSHSWHTDPKHLLFRLARYKFVAKMLAGSEHVLEIGCGDAFGTRLVQQEVKALSATDFDEVFVEDVKARMVERWRFRILRMICWRARSPETMTAYLRSTFWSTSSRTMRTGS
jgi:hypothetical protein